MSNLTTTEPTTVLCYASLFRLAWEVETQSKIRLYLTLVLSHSPAIAQEESRPAIFAQARETAANHQTARASEDTGVEIQTAPVKLDGRILFTVRGQTAYPAEKRAQLIAQHIESVARDRSFAPESIQLVETPFTTQIMAGQRR